jgi:hypothetical protein
MMEVIKKMVMMTLTAAAERSLNMADNRACEKVVSDVT